SWRAEAADSNDLGVRWRAEDYGAVRGAGSGRKVAAATAAKNARFRRVPRLSRQVRARGATIVVVRSSTSTPTDRRFNGTHPACSRQSTVMRWPVRIVTSITWPEDLECPWSDMKSLVVIRKENALFRQVTGLVVMANDDPQDDVAAVGCVEWSCGDLVELDIAALCLPDGLALFGVVASVQGSPYVRS